jgi:hypothetical protein
LQFQAKSAKKSGGITTMEGLQYLAEIPERSTREQFQILIKEPVYKVVKKFASRADMEQIDGWATCLNTIRQNLKILLNRRYVSSSSNHRMAHLDITTNTKQVKYLHIMHTIHYLFDTW